MLLFLVVVLLLLCVGTLVFGWFAVSVFPVWISSLWVFAVGCGVGCDLLGVILVWFWVSVVVAFVGRIFGGGFCFGFGFWIPADGLCYYDLSGFVLGCGFWCLNFRSWAIVGLPFVVLV